MILSHETILVRSIVVPGAASPAIASHLKLPSSANDELTTTNAITTESIAPLASSSKGITKDAVALKDSFAEEGTMDDSVLEEMATRWVDIEDEPEIIEEEV